MPVALSSGGRSTHQKSVLRLSAISFRSLSRSPSSASSVCEITVARRPLWSLNKLLSISLQPLRPALRPGRPPVGVTQLASMLIDENLVALCR